MCKLGSGVLQEAVGVPCAAHLCICTLKTLFLFSKLSDVVLASCRNIDQCFHIFFPQGGALSVVRQEEVFLGNKNMTTDSAEGGM